MLRSAQRVLPQAEALGGQDEHAQGCVPHHTLPCASSQPGITPGENQKCHLPPEGAGEPVVLAPSVVALPAATQQHMTEMVNLTQRVSVRLTQLPWCACGLCS